MPAKTKVIEGKKFCVTCKKIKLLEEFPTSKQNSTGRGSYCRVCWNEHLRIVREKKRLLEGKPVGGFTSLHKIVDGRRLCSKCKQIKPIEDFARNKNILCGYDARCLSCHRESSNRYNTSAIPSRYGITVEQYQEMLKAQNGLCAICKSSTSDRKGSRFHIDHNHETGVVRGLLCNNCNNGLGKLQDSLDILKAAIEYLKRYD